MVVEEEDSLHLLVLKLRVIQLIKSVGVCGLENPKQFELGRFDAAGHYECGTP